MQNVNFLPWIGKNYQSGFGSNGLKVLVLGESHYCFTRGEGKCADCSLENCIKAGFEREDFEQQTIEYIKDILYNNKKLPYQQTPMFFERALLGKKTLTQKEREAIWDHLMFYNYIQKSLPKIDGKRTEIKPDDLIGAERAFEEIIETYAPDRIIVWGTRLFNLLPRQGCFHTEEKLSEDKRTDVVIFDIGGRHYPAMKVAHPSSPQGWRWKYWHQFYVEFLMLKG